MIRLRSVLAAAAVLVAGGASLSIALRDAGQTEGITCAEWSQLVSLAQADETMEWFVAVADGYAPPSVTGDRVLGDCAAGDCAAKPAGCETAYSYTYQRSGSVGGWRLYRLRGPAYFAKGWGALATSNPSQVRAYRGWKEVGADCLAHFTGAQCRALLGGTGVCWRRGTQYCRNGLLYGPGLGGVNADGTPATCSAQAGDTPFPCKGASADYAARVIAADYPEGEQNGARNNQ